MTNRNVCVRPVSPDQPATVVQVAVPSPLYRLFDYLWVSAEPPAAGLRVRIRFGRQLRVGMVVRTGVRSELSPERLKPISEVLDPSPLLDPETLQLLDWAARYYHFPPGEVLAASLPTLLRSGADAQLAAREHMSLQELDASRWPAPGRAPVQRRLLEALLQAPAHTLEVERLRVLSPRWRTATRALHDAGLVQPSVRQPIPHNRATASPLPLLDEQQQALQAMLAARGGFSTHLLHGVTGSGKTEVYLRLIEANCAEHQQALVLVPEIALTPQLLQRFTERLSGCLVVLHSALNDAQRTQNWLLARQGHADVVIGTRSAVFTPLPRLGLIVVDEEHDGSFKQHEGFRYHARDVAIVRARNRGCPIVLGSATPSLETLHNAHQKRYTLHRLTRRPGTARAPAVSLLDVRRSPMIEGISAHLMAGIGRHLEAGGQVLVFINRRGFAPVLLCNACGAPADCRRCDAHMTVHARSQRLRCHHCGAERPLPAACEACKAPDLERVGHGTERVAAALEAAFPDIAVARIDRDSTRRKGALEARLEEASSGAARLLVGTQMLAKGHHFPNVSLVGILDSDRGLYGVDFHALEHMGQLIVQVAGRAGRATRPGEVLVQTRNPDNPMLQMLVREGYGPFAEAALQERHTAGWPPYSHVALVRAEAPDAHKPLAFLDQLRVSLQATAGPELQLLGPVPAPMERMAGRYRAQLLLQSTHRRPLNRVLAHLATQLAESADGRRVRWSIDVDPVDLM